MILVSGFNVYPNEIEDVVMLHPGVREAAVVGVPDAVAGERVKLVLVARDPQLDAETFLAHCRDLAVAGQRAAMHRRGAHAASRHGTPQGRPGPMPRSPRKTPVTNSDRHDESPPPHNGVAGFLADPHLERSRATHGNR